MTWLRLVLASAGLLAGSVPAYAAIKVNRDLASIPSNAVFLLIVGIVLAVMSTRYVTPGGDPGASRRQRTARRISGRRQSARATSPRPAPARTCPDALQRQRRAGAVKDAEGTVKRREP